MKSLLERIEGLDELISKMQRLESRMRSGEFIDAWKEITRIIAFLFENKRQIIREAQEEKKKQEK